MFDLKTISGSDSVDNRIICYLQKITVNQCFGLETGVFLAQIWHKFATYSVKNQPKIVKYVRFLYFCLIAVIPLYSWIWEK